MSASGGAAEADQLVPCGCLLVGNVWGNARVTCYTKARLAACERDDAAGADPSVNLSGCSKGQNGHADNCMGAVPLVPEKLIFDY